MPFSLEDVIQKKNSILLMPFDKVRFIQKVHEIVNKIVYIKGYVNAPGNLF